MPVKFRTRTNRGQTIAKSLGLELSLLVLVLVLVLAGCSMKGSGGKLSTPPVYPQVGGSWDFTAVATDGSVTGLETFLIYGNPGDLSGSITVNTFGGPGAQINSAMFEVNISGSSLASATGMAIDYLGNACGSDNGNRTLTGSIDLSGHASFTYVSGNSTIAFTGTFNTSATPSFSGAFTVSAPGCKADGQTGRITGVPVTSLTGTYSGVSASDNTETITMALTQTSGNTPNEQVVDGNGSDSKNGNFTVQAGVLGNFIEGNFSGPGSPYSNGLFFGYFDPRLGTKGSFLLTSFQGGNATSCPNGVPIDNGSCLIAILALQ